MIFPVSATPIESWGAIISFEDSGYVSDEDAESIDYDDLLADMQGDAEASNEERRKLGVETVKLVGWAAPPHYDRASHKLHWAKELEFGGSPSHTLNYNIRALGRKGVLQINFVAGMDQLAEIEQVIPAVLAMPVYDKGFRYEDFVPGVDKVAAVGIAGLIGGKLAAKAGLFVLLLAFLKKGWILAVLALGGLFGFLKRLFTRRPAETAAPPPASRGEAGGGMDPAAGAAVPGAPDEPERPA